MTTHESAGQPKTDDGGADDSYKKDQITGAGITTWFHNGTNTVLSTMLSTMLK
ncbi:conserved hypothetical protein [Halomonas sp. I3]|nr:conserved hypothetical protein [Halomonas sp. I3]VXB95410.1 conserved hypothetical protein [Halomonas titanicae]VXC73209.1 conserved hypothetical protein [Halomonas titanicae]